MTNCGVANLICQQQKFYLVANYIELVAKCIELFHNNNNNNKQNYIPN